MFGNLQYKLVVIQSKNHWIIKQPSRTCICFLS